jgi:hypothetical protein
LTEDEVVDPPPVDWITALGISDLFAPFRAPEAPPEDQPDFLTLLFPPFSAPQVQRIVFASRWQERLGAASIEVRGKLVASQGQGQKWEEKEKRE